MNDDRTRDEAIRILKDAREKVDAILLESSPDTGLEVIVVLAVRCDGTASELDIFTSTHCGKCALYYLSEATRMVEREEGESNVPN